MRRTLLSCTSLARNGLIALATAALPPRRNPRWPAELTVSQTISALLDLNHQEFAVLTTALALLGFSVVAAILLMRTRVRASRNGTRLRSDIADLQVQADRLRALLFAEPQILIAWAAGDNRPADQRRHLASDLAGRAVQFAAAHPRLWNLAAAGTGAADGPCGRRAARGRRRLSAQSLHLERPRHRSDGPRHRRPSHCADSRTRRACAGNSPNPISATGRCWRRPRLLRDFAAAAPWPIWAKSAEGNLRYANAAYVRATEGASVADAIHRNLELLESDQRAEMGRALNDNATFSARLPIVVGGERRIYDVQALKLGGGSAGIAIDASEATALRDGAWSGWRKRIAAPSTNCRPGVAVFDGQRRLAFYNESYRRLWGLDQAFLDGNPDDSSVLDRLRAARKLPEQPDFRAWKAKLHEAYRAVEPENYTWFLPDGRAVSVVTTPNLEGGVTYLFDDVTESLDLARRFDRLIRVQRETLDNLAEAVAVFGSNGRVATVQSGLREDVEAVAGSAARSSRISRPWKPGASRCSTTRRPGGRCARRSPRSRTASQVALKLERKDGSVLDCMTMPLPDGATMLTFQDITDTENVERALRERNEALEAADQMKVDFVHHVSYELRAPLTTIIGFAHFLSDPSTGPLTPKQAEYLDYVTKSTNALLALTNNILDLATIDAGAMKLELGPVDIGKAIAGRRRRHSGPARDRPHRTQGRYRSQYRQLHRRRAARGAGAL